MVKYKSMRHKLRYDTEADDAVFLESSVKLQDSSYDISAGTTGGYGLPGGVQKSNEDSFSVVIQDDVVMAAVFDGTSSQKPIPELGDISGARFASHTLKEIFELTPGETEVKVALQGLNRMLGERLRSFPSVNYNELNSLPTSTATIAKLNTRENRLDISHVGDSFAAVMYEDGATELLTNNLHRQYDEKVLELIYQIAIENNKTPREAREDPRIRIAIMNMFQDTRNRADGTGEGMANGDPNMDRYIYVRSLSLLGIRAVLLGSDGLVPPGMDESQEDDRKVLFDVVCQGGIKALVGLTRSIEDDDPDRWHVRYKHADDATGVLLQRADRSNTEF